MPKFAGHTKQSTFVLCIMLALLSTTMSAASAAVKSESPDKYVLDYPAIDRCCPPVRSAFRDADRTYSVIRGRRYRHKRNGGYGLMVVDKVDGQNLVHVGADLAWKQVGEPVFAIGNGVVRISYGPDFKADKKERRPKQGLGWGNFVAIEHKLDDEDYVTTVYGHLATKRLVKTGDVVTAGQQIGTIGRKHYRINGGYMPHLHFGVREGRNAEVGAKLLTAKTDGRAIGITLKELGEQTIELELSGNVAPNFTLTLGDRDFGIRTRDGKMLAPANMLWQLQRRDFDLVGYAKSTDGWKDPIKFLRELDADTDPAEMQAKTD